MKILKKTIAIIVILLLILSFKTELRAQTTFADNHTIITLKAKSKVIEKDVPIEVEIYLKNKNVNVYSLDCFIELNKDVFYDIDQNSFKAEKEMSSLVYLPDDENLILVLSDAIDDGLVATITLVPKVTLTGDEDINLIKFYDMQVVTEDFVQEDVDEERTAVVTLKDDPLFLSSEFYKIGNNDIENYEYGDLYISRVKHKTTVKDFAERLTTNGDIQVLGDGDRVLAEDEYVGTGMTLLVTKESEEIRLTIAVWGDLDGNGKVTATDLSTLNQTIVRLISLENEYFIAADIDENGRISATDLSEVNTIIVNKL